MNFEVSVIVNDHAYSIAEAAAAGYEVKVASQPACMSGELHRISFTNNSAQPVQLGGMVWHFTHEDLEAPQGFRNCWLDGWTMATPSGARQAGECDFSYNPDYLPYAVAEPADYRPGVPGAMRAENAVMFQNKEGGRYVLVAFVTSHHQYGRFTMDFPADGTLSLRAISGCDNRRVLPGVTVDSEELVVTYGTDSEAMLCGYAQCWGKKMNARLKYPTPAGWCSWYRYFDKVTQEDMAENSHFFAEHRNELPVQYIQLDDGYQRDLGDWLECLPTFDKGLDWVAKQIMDDGFIPGIWLAPFLVSVNSHLYAQHPEWLLKDSEGNVATTVQWRTGKAGILDATNPEVQEWYTNTFRQLRQWGFKYFKLDFLAHASSMRGGIRHNPDSTTMDVLRQGLEAMRRGAGEDSFILTCTAPFGAVVGLADGNRVSTDITPYWEPDHEFFDEAPTVPNVCRNDINHAFMHQRLFINDPDTLIVRQDSTKLTESECRFWYEALTAVGGALFFSDQMTTLLPERYAWLTELLPAKFDAFIAAPLDRFDNTYPREWRVESRKDGSVYILKLDYQTRKFQIVK